MLSQYFIFLLFAINYFVCSAKQETPVKQVKNIYIQDYRIEVFAQNLYVPWSLVFTDTNRLLVTERNGKLRIIDNGTLREEPLKEFGDISNNAEEGLMGLALDPAYGENRFIYLSCAFKSDGDVLVRILRFKDEGYSLSGEKVIFDNIPGASIHAGCRIRFGPDGKLYITTGDVGKRELAQDLTSLAGKILRLNPDGSVPSDNPFLGSPVWSLGHRNPQGIDWYPGTEILWETEHGPSGFDGPGGGDEVNVIVKGMNYGWPVVSHDNKKEGMVSPVLVFTPAEAPASGCFYGSDRIISFKNNFLFGCLRGNGIIKVAVDEKEPTKVLSYEKFATEYGRIRDVAAGPDGLIYFSTSNRDGRGNVRKGDDKIFRISSKP